MSGKLSFGVVYKTNLGSPQYGVLFERNFLGSWNKNNRHHVRQEVGETFFLFLDASERGRR